MPHTCGCAATSTRACVTGSAWDRLAAMGAGSMAATKNRTSVEDLNRANVGKLPEHIGLTITEVADGRVVGRFAARPDLVAHTGYLLAGARAGGGGGVSLRR